MKEVEKFLKTHNCICLVEPITARIGSRKNELD